jgi:hypothetical protein
LTPFWGRDSIGIMDMRSLSRSLCSGGQLLAGI